MAARADKDVLAERLERPQRLRCHWLLHRHAWRFTGTRMHGSTGAGCPQVHTMTQPRVDAGGVPYVVHRTHGTHKHPFPGSDSSVRGRPDVRCYSAAPGLACMRGPEDVAIPVHMLPGSVMERNYTTTACTSRRAWPGGPDRTHCVMVPLDAYHHTKPSHLRAAACVLVEQTSRAQQHTAQAHGAAASALRQQDNCCTVPQRCADGPKGLRIGVGSSLRFARVALLESIRSN